MKWSSLDAMCSAQPEHTPTTEEFKTFIAMQCVVCVRQDVSLHYVSGEKLSFNLTISDNSDKS